MGNQLVVTPFGEIAITDFMALLFTESCSAVNSYACGCLNKPFCEELQLSGSLEFGAYVYLVLANDYH